MEKKDVEGEIVRRANSIEKRPHAYYASASIAAVVVMFFIIRSIYENRISSLEKMLAAAEAAREADRSFYMLRAAQKDSIIVEASKAIGYQKAVDDLNRNREK